MRKVILHIGGPKAASSTIQKYLGQHFCGERGVINHHQQTLKYCRIGPQEKISSGRSLYRAHLNSPTGYVASIPFKSMKSGFVASLDRVLNHVKANEIPIVSSEGWAASASAYDLKSRLEQSDITVDVFFVVRSPIDWINSAWWQWGVWGNTALDKWIPGMIRAANFYEHYLQWKTIRNVSRIKMVDISQNPVSQFQGFLQVEALSTEPANQGTHPALLEHLVANKDKYNRTVHNPKIEFHFNRALDLPRRPLPFVISKDWQQYIIEKTADNSKKLIAEIERSGSELSPRAKHKFLSAAAYADLPVRTMSAIATDEERGELITRLMQYAPSLA